MNSHQYAHRLKALADFLLSRPEFTLYVGMPKIHCYFGTQKVKFLHAARSLGAVTKKYTQSPLGEIEIAPVEFPEFSVYANRETVCRKVQEEKWECEPLLSADEEAEIGGAQ